MKRTLVALVAAVMMTGACASMRGVKVGTDKSAAATYQVSVRNTRSTAITVMWVDATGTQELGSVRAGQTLAFNVSAASGTLRAVNTSGTSIGSKAVNLSNGSQTVSF
ncbi:MAG TPA: hypothetical protein VM100_01540 [Longimicrobiales bacterium]|nr:hypothetical protein [Longimicrobiales bacterium]